MHGRIHREGVLFGICTHGPALLVTLSMSMQKAQKLRGGHGCWRGKGLQLSSSTDRATGVLPHHCRGVANVIQRWRHKEFPVGDTELTKASDSIVCEIQGQALVIICG